MGESRKASALSILIFNVDRALVLCQTDNDNGDGDGKPIILRRLLESGRDGLITFKGTSPQNQP